MLALLGCLGSGLIASQGLFGVLGPVVFMATVALLLLVVAVVQQRRVTSYRRRSQPGEDLFRAHQRGSSFDILVDPSGLRLQTRILPQRHAWAEVVAHEMERSPFEHLGTVKVRLRLRDGRTESFTVEDPDRFDLLLRRHAP